MTFILEVRRRDGGRETHEFADHPYFDGEHIGYYLWSYGAHSVGYDNESVYSWEVKKKDD